MVTQLDVSLLAIVPARGGSKGIPGKNLRVFAGMPLVAHAILMARLCPDIRRLIVSTDSDEIASVARNYGAEVPFIRPAGLAQDDTPMWPVVRHALEETERTAARPFDFVLLLDPTTPCRMPDQISDAFRRLRQHPDADGIVGVSRPDFSPIWHSVVERDGWMAPLFPDGQKYDCRQDVPVVYRINGSLYIWKAQFVREQADRWNGSGKHLMYEVPDFSAISIDTPEEFARAELFVRSGIVTLPWLDTSKLTACAPSTN